MTEAIDITKLESQAQELRGGMMTALQAGNDSEVKKLGNELAATNKRIADGQASAQADSRGEFMAKQHDALALHELDGFNLTVKWAIDAEGAETFSAAYTPNDSIIAAIKDALVTDRPSTVKQFTYGWVASEDGTLQPNFDFGKTTVKRGSSNGTSTPGWSKDGNDVSLGDAFKACATKAEQAEHDGKDNTSKQYVVKVRVVKAAGYSKK